MLSLESKTIREIALESPATTRVFEEFRIDYCCHGESLLADACHVAGADTEVITQKVTDVLNSPSGRTQDPLTELSLNDLIAYILRRHHYYTRQEIEQLMPLMQKVVSRHGRNHPYLFDMMSVFREFCGDLLPHLTHEEVEVFPFISNLESNAMNGSSNVNHVPGRLDDWVAQMKGEHEQVGRLLSQLREQSSGYSAPRDACLSFAALFRRLANLELDMHQHIHLENNVLFPKACKLEYETLQSGKTAG